MATVNRDVHLHSEFSFDAVSTIREFAERAIELGLKEICITDHQEVELATRVYRPYDGPAHEKSNLAMAEEYRGRVDVRFGTEMGLLWDTAEEAMARVAAHPYDFVILSAHWCDGAPEFHKPELWQGYTNRDVFTMHLKKVLEYMDLVNDYDVLGHLTYFSRWSPYEKIFRYTDAADMVDTLLKQVIARGKGIEVNTSSVVKQGVSLPDADILARYKELGGTIVTVGSDAHHVDHLGQNLQYAADMLASVGFTHYSTYHGRKPVFHRL